MIVDMNMARVEREEDNVKITVEELLKLALKDATTGMKASKAFVCIVEEGDDSYSLASYRCGLTRAEELGVIEAFKLQTWKRWMDDAK